MAAVRELRADLGENQQTFGMRLGLSTISVARYERSRAPRGKVLARLAEIAADRGLDKLEDTFRRALNEEFGGATPAGSKVDFSNAGEQDLILALLDILRKPQYAREAETVKQILEPVALLRRENADFLEAQQRGRIAIIKLLRKGYAVEVIMSRMGEPVERIAEALFHSADLELMKQWVPEVVGLLLKHGWTTERVFQRFGHGLMGPMLSDILKRGAVKRRHSKEPGTPGKDEQ
jgi:transcriptional regulator with XRE-family HTH domain